MTGCGGRRKKQKRRALDRNSCGIPAGGGGGRRKKQKRRALDRNSCGIPGGGGGGIASAAAGQQGWSELPDLPLLIIFEHLISLTDLFAFASICRSWRSISRSSVARSSLATRPPLLLRPVLADLRLRPRCRRWLMPRRCMLDSPTGESNQCVLTSATLSEPFLGYSNGNLIFRRLKRVLIADVFARSCEILSPEVPRYAQDCHHGFLTAPPSSPECWLLLSGPNTSLMCWRMGSDKWSGFPTGVIVPPIQQVLVFKGKVYALDSIQRILTIQFSPQLSVEPLQPQLAMKGIGSQQLVECGGKLLVVCFLQDSIFNVKIAIYSLDPSEANWTMIESLGDWSLFLDFSGRFPVSCINPSKWGGRSNCIYVVGPGCDNWMVHSLETVINCLPVESPFCPQHTILPRWPSPIWVYPSMFF